MTPPETIMRTLVLAVASVVLFAHAMPVAAQSRAKADILDMEDKDRALVAKEGIKQRREMAGMKRDGQSASKSGSNPGCGSVDIGNSSNNKGSSRINERQTTVIVTGPIINTANCR
jgi:hypothetical protein